MTKRKKRPSRRLNLDPHPGPDPGQSLAPDPVPAPNQSRVLVLNHAPLQDPDQGQSPGRGHVQHLAKDLLHRLDRGHAPSPDQSRGPNRDLSRDPNRGPSRGLNQDLNHAHVLLANHGPDLDQSRNLGVLPAPGVSLDLRVLEARAVLLLNRTNIYTLIYNDSRRYYSHISICNEYRIISLVFLRIFYIKKSIFLFKNLNSFICSLGS